MMLILTEDINFKNVLSCIPRKSSNLRGEEVQDFSTRRVVGGSKKHHQKQDFYFLESLGAAKGGFCSPSYLWLFSYIST